MIPRAAIWRFECFRKNLDSLAGEIFFNFEYFSDLFQPFFVKKPTVPNFSSSSPYRCAHIDSLQTASVMMWWNYWNIQPTLLCSVSRAIHNTDPKYDICKSNIFDLIIRLLNINLLDHFSLFNHSHKTRSNYIIIYSSISQIIRVKKNSSRSSIFWTRYLYTWWRFR